MSSHKPAVHVGVCVCVCVCVHQLCLASLHTPQLCGEVVQYDLNALNCFWMVSAFVREVMRSVRADRHR